jgi:DNA-binding GntR family transcriptional regulator
MTASIDPVAALSAPPRRTNVKLDRSLHFGRVTQVLREAILTGELPPGTPLVERRIAGQLDVSRGPVRSALAVLEQEGLALTAPNGRMQVLGFDSQHLADLFRVRLHLESLAIRWGIEARQDPTKLRDALEAMEREGSSTDRLVELDIAFHRSLVEFSGSRSLLLAWSSFSGLLETVIKIGNRNLRERDPEGDFHRIMGHHRPLAEAVVARKPRIAEQLLREQFEVTSSMLSVRES